jgi:hypothetical protein
LLTGAGSFPGLVRWTSGFPFSVDGGQRWPTDWFLAAVTQDDGQAEDGRFQHGGSVNVFDDPATAQADFTLPLPGGVGSRSRCGSITAHFAHTNAKQFRRIYESAEPARRHAVWTAEVQRVSGSLLEKVFAVVAAIRT